MGHQRIGTLPASRPWREVVALIRADASAAMVAAAVLDAAEAMFTTGADDLVFRQSLWLLVRLPQAARGDFVEESRGMGIDLPIDPDLMDVVAATSRALDAATPGCRRRTDLGEMARLTFASVLCSSFGPGGPADLFGSADGDTQASLRRRASSDRFGPLAASLFAAFSERCFNYSLTRALGSEVGEGRAFRTLAEHDRFLQALGVHGREASVILEEFAGDWVGNRRRECDGRVTPDEVSAFAGFAMTKLVGEFRVRGQG